MIRPLCIYHANCADGFTAAWAVWRALDPEVDFHPAHYGAAPPDVTGRDVILVDFSYKRPVLTALGETARSVLILDHHKSAAEDLANLPTPDIVDGDNWGEHLHRTREGAYAGLPAALFDMARSGAQLAWDFFHCDPRRPALVDYVADRDLWRFALPNSRDVAAALRSHPFNFHLWDDLADRIESPATARGLIAEGAAIDRKHLMDVSDMVRATRREMVIGGHRVPVANLPSTMASDAGNLMAQGQPFAATYYDSAGGQRLFSLRSTDAGEDVSRIAALYGGSGHRNAAGFQAPAGWCGDA